MATSNLSDIVTAFVAEIDKATTINRPCETNPSDADDWVSHLIAANVADQMPAVHVEVGKQEIETTYTDGTMEAKLPLKVTVVVSYSGDAGPTVWAIYEDVIDKVLDDLSLGGFVELLDCTDGPEIVDQTADITRFEILFEATHIWARP